MNDDRSSSHVSVELVTVPAAMRDVLLERAGQAQLLFLPWRVTDRRGEYRVDDLQTVKALRAAGVSVDWAHPPQERTFTSEYSAEAVLAVGLFVAQALAEQSVGDVARWLLSRVRVALAARVHKKGGPPVIVEVARFVVDGDRREIEGFRVSGQDERIVDKVISLLKGEQ